MPIGAPVLRSTFALAIERGLAIGSISANFALPRSTAPATESYVILRNTSLYLHKGTHGGAEDYVIALYFRTLD